MGDFISREAVIIEAERVPLNYRNYRKYGDVVRAIPAADVVPVRHGRWKLGICQECLFDWSEVSLYANVPNYCPSCGARMDGGQDNG